MLSILGVTCLCGWVETSVQREHGLLQQPVFANRKSWVEKDVPALFRNGTGNGDKRMMREQVLFRDAWERNVIVVSPSTLLFVVRTVVSSMTPGRHRYNELRSRPRFGHARHVMMVRSLWLRSLLVRSSTVFGRNCQRSASGAPFHRKHPAATASTGGISAASGRQSWYPSHTSGSSMQRFNKPLCACTWDPHCSEQRYG